MINRVKQDRTLRIAAQKCYPNASHQVLIGKLKSQNIRLGLVTNSVRITTEFMLTYAGLIDMMEVIVTNEDVLAPKPSPEGYLKAMEKLGVLPGETVIVEDGHYGIAAAKASGANVIEVSGVDDVCLDLFANLLINESM
jgi:HAD superfamily hydrolase (TIGR01509 family)